MRRRDFIAGIGSTAAWPLAARAQQTGVPVIGFLGNDEPRPHILAAVLKGLKQAGFVEGRNLIIEKLWVKGRYDRLPALAAELVRRRVNVIFAVNFAMAAKAAMAATSSIPIVFSAGVDPVTLGLVASLNHPGGNVTGVSFFTSALLPKRLELLRELVPGVATIAVLTNPANIRWQSDVDDIEAAARRLGQRIVIVRASTVGEIDAAFATIAQQRAGALLVEGETFFVARQNQIAALAERDALPAIYDQREVVDAGGLISYGDDRAEGQYQAGIYLGRILKGKNPRTCR